MIARQKTIDSIPSISADIRAIEVKKLNSFTDSLLRSMSAKKNPARLCIISDYAGIYAANRLNASLNYSGEFHNIYTHTVRYDMEALLHSRCVTYAEKNPVIGHMESMLNSIDSVLIFSQDRSDIISASIEYAQFANIDTYMVQAGKYYNNAVKPENSFYACSRKENAAIVLMAIAEHMYRYIIEQE